MQPFDAPPTYLPGLVDPHAELQSTEDEVTLDGNDHDIKLAADNIIVSLSDIAHQDINSPPPHDRSIPPAPLLPAGEEFVSSLRDVNVEQVLHDFDAAAMIDMATEVPLEEKSIATGTTDTDVLSLVVPDAITDDNIIAQNPDFASIARQETEVVDLALPLSAVNVIDSGAQAVNHLAPQDLAEIVPVSESFFSAMLAMNKKMEDEAAGHVVKHRSWPWLAGISLCVLLLLAQSVYFFRTGLAVHLPVIKPALLGFCHALNCSMPLPQNAELISIESSGLEADPEHENQIAFTALLRNRAAYTQSFPELALTLDDNQDKPVARRFFGPRDYLPADENAQAGFQTNHEFSVKLRFNVDDLRPAGYRLELFYKK